MTISESNLKGVSIVQQLRYDPTEEKAQEEIQQKGLSCDLHLWNRTLNELAWRIEKNRTANPGQQDPELGKALKGPSSKFSYNPDPFWVCNVNGVSSKEVVGIQQLRATGQNHTRIVFERKGNDLFFLLDFLGRPQNALEADDLVGYIARYLQQVGLIDLDVIEQLRDEFNRKHSGVNQ